MSAWHVVQFVDGVLPAPWQAAHSGGVAPVPLKSFPCIAVTSVPWQVEVKHEPETTCDALPLPWVAVKKPTPWQVSHVAPPAAIAATSVASVEEWHVAQVGWMATTEVPWHGVACVQVAVPVLMLETTAWFPSCGPLLPWHTVQSFVAA